MELELEKIAKNILIARTIKGFTQEGLGSKIGMTQAWVQKVEKGEIDLSISSINKICKGLEIEPINLLFSSPTQILNFKDYN
jgi:transcriptional regulator with XRE-family HTH domain